MTALFTYGFDFDLFQGFKSLPLHFFLIFQGETRHGARKRFELLNTSTNHLNGDFK